MTEPGVTFLDHTADVGIDVVAPDLPQLFHRAGRGLMALLAGREEEGADGTEASGADAGPEAAGAGDDDGGEAMVDVELEARDRPGLLARWLKELLFLHEARQRDYREARFEALEETELRARVETGPAAPPVREIKGVTYHELHVTRTDDGWTARVIFDV